MLARGLATSRLDGMPSLRDNSMMPKYHDVAIDELRNELRSFKEASGPGWANAAVQLAGAVEAFLEYADGDHG